jgi:hypothetical protein
MTEVLRKSIARCGIEVINNRSRLKAILSDFLPGTKNKFERKFLLDALEIDEWHILLETHDKGQAEHTRAINVLLPLLQNHLRWTEASSILILDCYTTAMGWNDVAITQTQTKPQMQANKVTTVIDNETLELLEFVRQLKNNSGGEISQQQQTMLMPPPIAVTPPKRSIAAAPVIGSTLKFGPYEWRVLNVQEDKALLITKDVTHVNMPYNKSFVYVTWETCTLRKWLNEDFLHTFSGQEQSRIALITNVNKDNQWYRTTGGNNTTDRIFLLSVSEVFKYFGNSGQLENASPNSGYWISDQYNQERIANYGYSSVWWWLRSPGCSSNYAAGVSNSGYITLSGTNVSYGGNIGGVRAALWLNL